MGLLEKALNAAKKAGQKGARKLKANHEKLKAEAKAKTKARLEAIKKNQPAIKPFKPKSQQPATSAKPVAVTPK